MKRALFTTTLLAAAVALADLPLRQGSTDRGAVTSLNCVLDGGLMCQRTQLTTKGTLECVPASNVERGCIAPGDQTLPYGAKTFSSADGGNAVVVSGSVYLDGGLTVHGDISLRTNDRLDFGPGADDYCKSNGTNVRCASTWYFDSANVGIVLGSAAGQTAVAVGANGARVDFGAGPADFLYSDGVSIIVADGGFLRFADPATVPVGQMYWNPSAFSPGVGALAWTNNLSVAGGTLKVSTGGTAGNGEIWSYGGVVLQEDGVVTQPACAVGYRGMLWHVQGAGGVADKLQICNKSSANAYAWRDVFVAP